MINVNSGGELGLSFLPGRPGGMSATGRISRAGVAGEYASADAPIPRKRQSRLAVLTLWLYLATLSVDAVRKAAGLPASTIGVIYIVTAMIYAVAIMGKENRRHDFPRALPVLLFLISVWCLTVAVLQNISFLQAFLGWSSYVFFVPLLYVGAELAADDALVAKCLRVIVISGALVGIGAIASVALGASAPSVLQPIVPTSGIHTFGDASIYLAPSFFATSEEAAEQLLVAAFAWSALMCMGNSAKGRVPLALLGVLVASGLIATARRADIYVAIAGIIAVLLLWRARAPHRRMVGPRNRLGAAVFFAIAGVVALIPFLGGAKLASFLTSGSAGSRISLMFALPGNSLLGQGPGTSTQGSTVIGASPGGTGLTANASSILNNRVFLGAEGGMSKTWLEIGIMGVVLYGAIFWVSLAPAIRSLRRLDGAALAFTVLAIALGVIFLKGHQSLDDPLIQPLFWLAVGGIWGRMRAAVDVDRAD